MSQIKRLKCCCCGRYTRGKQWYNRDNGFGICPECVEYCKQHGESAEIIKSNYGFEGVNYNIGISKPACASKQLSIEDIVKIMVENKDKKPQCNLRSWADNKPIGYITVISPSDKPDTSTFRITVTLTNGDTITTSSDMILKLFKIDI